MPKTKLGSPPDLHLLLGKVRQLTEQFKAGDLKSFGAFRELVAILLGYTVAASGQAPRLTRLKGSPDRQVLSGPGGPTTPLKLRNNGYLKLVAYLDLEDTENGPRLKVTSSSYQYQLGENRDDWVFRYDYWRQAPEKHPAAHLHVRADLRADTSLDGGMLHERVHYPTGRVSLEAIIRLLIEQYGIEPASPVGTWRALLLQSETLFREIAHNPDLPS